MNPFKAYWRLLRWQWRWNLAHPKTYVAINVIGTVAVLAYWEWRERREQEIALAEEVERYVRSTV